MFTNAPPPLHALQAAARLNEGAHTFVTAKINTSMSINTAQSPPKLYINTWQWLPALYTKILIQNRRSYLSYSYYHTLSKPTSQIEGPRKAKTQKYNRGNISSHLINPS